VRTQCFVGRKKHPVPRHQISSSKHKRFSESIEVWDKIQVHTRISGQLQANPLPCWQRCLGTDGKGGCICAQMPFTSTVRPLSEAPHEQLL